MSAVVSTRRALVASLVVGLGLFSSAGARAYCRSASCPGRPASDPGQVCSPAQPDDCGLVIQWRLPCIGFGVQKDASSQIDFATASTTLEQAFSAWTQADCGHGPPSIEVHDLGSVDCDKVEYNQHDGNASILVFRDKSWPHDGDPSAGVTDTIALTTVTYDVDKGDIYDADIEVNTANNRFTTGVSDVDVDLLSVLTHEAGHFLGMAHSADGDATMFPNYTNGDLSLRTLSADDIEGICDAYPPERQAVGTCEGGLPRHGFSPFCKAEQTEGKCSASPGPLPSPAGWLAIAAGAVFLQITRARARRKIS